ncbi:hypothetical protein [Streptomyces sp. NPDC020607]|uniref:hypothetical protein n=1 Tax=Streptomyces sp. NPDC020607 TaxID=3365082 RepID=UPI0037B9E53D
MAASQLVGDFGRVRPQTDTEKADTAPFQALARSFAGPDSDPKQWEAIVTITGPHALTATSFSCGTSPR